MKRITTLFLILLLCLPLACAKKPETEVEPTPVVIAPAAQDVKLKFPLGARNDVAKAIPGYTAGFQTTTGESLTFTAVSSDIAVAEAILKDDGTLYVIAHGVGEAKLTVTALTPSGEKASAVVSVKVTDARRTVALVLLGVLVVALLILLGKPSAKKPEPPVIVEEPEKEPEVPVVIFEEEPTRPVQSDEKPNDDPERS